MPMEAGAALLLCSVSKVIDNKSALCVTVSDAGGNRQTFVIHNSYFAMNE